MSIAQNLTQIKSQLPTHVTLVAVSKTKPVADLMEAYNAGQRIFGENKIQEMTEKWEQMPKDIEWHMIGHVQTNKVKFMAEYVSLVHGVDSLKLLEENLKEYIRKTWANLKRLEFLLLKCVKYKLEIKSQVVTVIKELFQEFYLDKICLFYLMGLLLILF